MKKYYLFSLIFISCHSSISSENTKQDIALNIAKYLCIAFKLAGDTFCSPGKALFKKTLPHTLNQETRERALERFENSQFERVCFFGCASCAAVGAACCCAKCGCPVASEYACKTAYALGTAAIITPQIPSSTLIRGVTGPLHTGNAKDN